MINKIWKNPAVIAENNFKYKSLSNWSYNIAVGCAHACKFCYVPQVSANRMASKLKDEYGVNDPDEQWGEYVFPREWDLAAFRSSMWGAEKTKRSDLKPDGNRAVMLCTTTDPYQTLKDKVCHEQIAKLTRLGLEYLLNDSTLNVRILTRSPLARVDFPLMKKFGKRLLFGMSLPTLNNQLAKVYEPKAPAPTLRLETLRAAKAAGLNVYVAIAPTYPECDEADLHRTLTAVKELNPVTIFHEPINIRADNVERIRKQGELAGVKLKTEVFADRETWFEYARTQLLDVEGLAKEIGVIDRLHLWPDAMFCNRMSKTWLDKYWNRISEWPK